jgi:hypothetical protein
MARDDTPQDWLSREWDAWARRHPNDAKVSGGILFFSYLKRKRSDLLLDLRRPAINGRPSMRGY